MTRETRRKFAVAAAGAAGLISHPWSADAATSYLWKSGANSTWSNTADWTPTGVPSNPGDIASYNSASAGTATLDSSYTVGQLVNLNTASFTVGVSNSSVLTLDNTPGLAIPTGPTGDSFIGTTGTGPLTVNPAIVIANTDLALGINSATGGTLTINGGITGTSSDNSLVIDANGTGALTVQTGTVNMNGSLTNSGTGSNSVTISANIGSNVTGVTENSALSTLTLSGSNSFAGPVTISAGTLAISNAAALGTGAGNLNLNGGTLSDPTASYTIANPVVLGGSTSVTTKSSSVLLTFSNTVNGTGPLNVYGPTVLTGTNSYSGNTTVTGTTLTISNSSALGTGSLGFANSSTGTLAEAAGSTVTYNGNITIGSGAIADLNTANTSVGTLTLSGAITGGSAFSGSTPTAFLQEITAGNVVLSGSGDTFTGELSVNQAVYVTNLAAGDPNALYTSTNVYSNLNLNAAAAAGTFTLGAVGGVLNIYGSNSSSRLVTTVLGSAGITATANGNFGDISYSYLNLVMSGTGTENLAALNTYQGTTTVEGGTLIAGNDAANVQYVYASGSQATGSSTLTLTSTAGLVVGAALYSGNSYTSNSTNKEDIITAISGNTITLAQVTSAAGPIPNNAQFSVEGSLGNTTSVVTLGDSTTNAQNYSPSLLTGGAFTIARPITVANFATTGTYSIGGNVDTTSSFSGAITINQPLTITQVATGSGNGLLNISGGIASASGTQTVTFAGPGAINVSTTAIADGTSTNYTAVAVSGGSIDFSASNTYSGSTSINAGTLVLDAANNAAATLAKTFKISLSGASSLKLLNVAATANTNMVNDSAAITVMTVNSVDPTIELDLGAPATYNSANANQLFETVGPLTYNTTAQPNGLYSSTSEPTGATIPETDFLGNGELNVTPEPSSVVLLILGTPALLARRRRRLLRIDC